MTNVFAFPDCNVNHFGNLDRNNLLAAGQFVRCSAEQVRNLIVIGVPDRGAGRAVAPLGFGKLVKFGQMGWEIRAFRGLNFSR